MEIGSQGGLHYELRNVRAWAHSLEFLLEVKPSNFDEDKDGDDAEGTCSYAAKIGLAYRSNQHLYAEGQGNREPCVKVEVGELNLGTGKFSGWVIDVEKRACPDAQCIMVGQQDLVAKLFYQKSWPLNIDIATGGLSGNTQPDSLEQFRSPTGKLRYHFDVIDDRLSHSVKEKGSDEPGWFYLANFYVVKCIALYQFVDGSHMPYHKLLCRRLVSEDGEGTVYLREQDSNRTPDLTGAKYLDVEVLINVAKIKTQPEINTIFQAFQSMLGTCMTVDQLGCYMLSYPQPLPMAVITRFGRQPDETFVAGNCAFKHGELMTHEDAGVAIVSNYFSEMTQPLTRQDYPKHCIIPYAYIRYTIGVRIYNEVMPQFFECVISPPPS